MSKCKKFAILDTNVIAVASQAVPLPAGVNSGLIAWCAEIFESIRQGAVQLVVDDGSVSRIVSEYVTTLGQSSQARVIVKWMYDNQWNPQYVQRQKITKSGDDFVEFPTFDVRLAKFDKSDRVFVAVAKGFGGKAPIYEATDGKWWKWAKALEDNGVKVIFGDLRYIQELCKKKNRCGTLSCKECRV